MVSATHKNTNAWRSRTDRQAIQNENMNPNLMPTFDPSARGFSLVNARACALYSQQVYHGALIQSELSHVDVCLTTQGELVVAYRGTANLMDWITDAKFRKVATPYGFVHNGFWDAFRSTLDQVMSEIGKGPANLPIYITGHSLGGAQAVLLATHIARSVPAIVHLYTFGQPRVGDAAFARRSGEILAGLHHRLINGEDIVARLPGWLAGFRHSGARYLFDAFGGLDTNPPLWRMALSDAWGICKEWNRGTVAVAEDVFADHGIDNYVAYLSQTETPTCAPLIPPAAD